MRAEKAMILTGITDSFLPLLPPSLTCSFPVCSQLSSILQIRRVLMEEVSSGQNDRARCSVRQEQISRRESSLHPRLKSHFIALDHTISSRPYLSPVPVFSALIEFCTKPLPKDTATFRQSQRNPWPSHKGIPCRIEVKRAAVNNYFPSVSLSLLSSIQPRNDKRSYTRQQRIELRKRGNQYG